MIAVRRSRVVTAVWIALGTFVIAAIGCRSTSVQSPESVVSTRHADERLLAPRARPLGVPSARVAIAATTAPR